MAKLTEILETESNRKDNNKVFLFKEGSFYRAYEYSAYLCSKFINQSFKATRKELDGNKMVSSFVFIGFPVTSLEKYLLSGTKRETSEKLEVIELSDVTGTSEDDFKVWKESIPLTEAKEKKDFSPTESNSLTAIMKTILSYPLEQKSPVENLLFLSDLKKRLSNIL